MSESSLAAPCALFVHGAGGGAWEWNVWTRVFTARGWRTHAIELEPVEGGYAATRLSDYRMQVEAAVRASSPSVLVGASLGGWLAYAVADAVSALVLVNPLPPSPWHHALRRAEPYPDVVCWRDARRLDGTLAAMPDSDAAARLYAFRSWRNE